MKKILLFILAVLIFTFIGCEAEYEGNVKANGKPSIAIYQTPDTLSNNKTIVSWYGNDVDGFELKYYYFYTTDSTMNSENILDNYPRDLWDSTSEMSAEVSFPYTGDWYSELFIIDTTGVDTTGTVVPDTTVIKTVYSKFFVFGKDSKGEKTNIASKIFARRNNPPRKAKITSKFLKISGTEEAHIRVNFPNIVLPKTTQFWDPIDFRWLATDSDATAEDPVDLEYRWKLYASSQDYTLNDSIINYDVLVDSSHYTTNAGLETGWNIVNTRVSFSSKVYDYLKDNNLSTWFKFVVETRDDALVKAPVDVEVEFYCFAPQFDKGILFVDDSDTEAYDPEDEKTWTGTPSTQELREYYVTMLGNCDVEGVNLTESDESGIDHFTYWNVNALDSVPTLEDLSHYRLIVVDSESRSHENGVNLNYGTGTSNAFGSRVISYLNTGGKLFMIGNTLFTSISNNNYSDPARIVVSNSSFSEDFMLRYLGIYALTVGEGYARKVTDEDFYNYDFVGVSAFGHTPDIGGFRVYPENVNKFWKYRKFKNDGTLKYDYFLKDDASVFTGITTFESSKGEVIYKYNSLFGLEKVNETTVVGPDGVQHSLLLPNGDGEFITNRNDLDGDGLSLDLACGNRYIAVQDLFRTAVIGIPLYFMSEVDDNGNFTGNVQQNFKAMIDWFEIHKDPLDKFNNNDNDNK